MIRVILAPKERLTPFDLRGQIFRVNLEFSTYYRGLKIFSKKWPKVTFRLERKFFSRFFETVRFVPQTTKRIWKFFFRPVGVLSIIFFKNSFRFLWPRYSSSISRMTEYLLLTINNEISLHLKPPKLYQPGNAGRSSWNGGGRGTGAFL